MTPATFEIVDVTELAVGQVLDVINTAFGRNENAAWYEWKHREGPWGPSIGVAAVDADGPIGLRLLLPWRLRYGDQTFGCHRATEAATIPRAQGRGVFTALNRWMMEEVDTDLIFSTPNLKSRTGYLKLGWREIAKVPHRWELALRPRENESAPELAPLRAPLRTDWDPAGLRWRADPRSGLVYHATSMDGGVLYYRTFRRRGIPVVAPLGSIAEPAQHALLWRRMLSQSRAPLVLRPATQPAPTAGRPGIQRGESLILGWRPQQSATALPDWDFFRTVPWAAADIEGVI